eukprot:PhM_4_TR14114/c2_g3_i1/m.42932
MMSRKLPALLLLLIPVLLPSTAVVSATTCDFGVLETWPNKGTCHEIHHNSKKYESLISIFDAANVPDLLNSGSYNVKEFYVSVSAAMCHAFVVDVGSSGLSVATNTVSELKLSGSQSAATYQNVVRGVMLRICPEPRVYNIVWYFTQETTGLAENTNGNSEQHYYKSYGQANWIDAVAICDATTFAGLRGYLTVADDLQETNWLWNHFRENLWMGVSDDGNQGTWTVRTGPHAGELAYLNFAPGQPDNTVGSDLTQHYAINFDGRWDDHVYTANHLVVYGHTSRECPIFTASSAPHRKTQPTGHANVVRCVLVCARPQRDRRHAADTSTIIVIDTNSNHNDADRRPVGRRCDVLCVVPRHPPRSLGPRLRLDLRAG